ncbi:cupin domain-containing protein [Polaromonas sp. SM01]|uniref:cupin domain-containing protein n=1 Tax=Polaromonas sp. SM01 TaxID=3085630 RepID=UPI002981A535|nr:cupin domain-containing protein [Polaromonas sp. SM01]MDW5444288.1 cupin domain-containing protein [Polaromonas sp. SM01]
MSATLTYQRLYADDMGVSHFAPLDVEVSPREFAPPAPPFSVSAFTPASRCGFLHLTRGWSGDLHPSPLCMWIIVLSGEMALEAGDGTQQRIAPGSALLLEDTVGVGHRSRVLGNAAANLFVVHV